MTEEADADLDIAFERLAQALVHNDQVSQDLQRQQSDSRFKKVVVPAVVLTEPDPVDAR